MVASEAAPYAKTGGLADVLGALPRALARLGHAIDVLLPRYRGVTAGEPIRRLRVELGGSISETTAHVVAPADGVRVVFIERPGYFDREYLYGAVNDDYADNPERFGFLARAAVAWLESSEHRYDVVHAHDWQAGLVPVWLRRVPTIFTIHNLAYQGLFDAGWLARLGLGWELMHVDALEYHGRISFLKGGIQFSRLVTTVSPRYAHEIQTPELGFGFDGILRARSAALVGILNGIDYDEWNPGRDRYLPEPFGPDQLEGKAAAKRALLEAFGLPVSRTSLERPVVGLVSRLVDQKGFDLLAALGDELPRLGAAFVILGSGERAYEDFWRALASRHPDQVAARIGFDEGLAHLVEGGADLFLMPSRFEPCGLNQMYSLRYGTVPVVRATGGLSDTVENYDPQTGDGTGFTFDEYSPGAVLGALRRALGVFGDRAAWRRLQRAGMSRDLSWDASARRYVQAYERAAGTAGAAA